MKTLVLVFALVVVVANAQPGPVRPRCTETPPEWFGYFREVNYDARPGQVGFRFANVSYSRTERKIKIVEFERRQGDERRFEISTDILLFNENKRYTIEEGRCRPGTIPETIKFPEGGIPEGATFYGADYLGAQVTGLGVLVDQFHHRTGSGDESGDYHGSFAPIGGGAICIPVIESYVNSPSRVPPSADRTNVQLSFYNLTTTLPVGAFTIPRVCEQPPVRGRVAYL